jgi:hypothetical protein
MVKNKSYVYIQNIKIKLTTFLFFAREFLYETLNAAVLQQVVYWYLTYLIYPLYTR